MKFSCAALVRYVCFTIISFSVEPRRLRFTSEEVWTSPGRGQQGCNAALRAAQITNDPRKIDAAITAFDEALVDRGGASPKRRRRVARARGGLREFQILKHHGSGKARLEIAVCGRGRHQTRHWTIARHGPALPRRFRGNLKQPLRIQPELFRE